MCITILVTSHATGIGGLSLQIPELVATHKDCRFTGRQIHSDKRSHLRSRQRNYLHSTTLRLYGSMIVKAHEGFITITLPSHIHHVFSGMVKAGPHSLCQDCLSKKECNSVHEQDAPHRGHCTHTAGPTTHRKRLSGCRRN